MSTLNSALSKKLGDILLWRRMVNTNIIHAIKFLNNDIIVHFQKQDLNVFFIQGWWTSSPQQSNFARTKMNNAKWKGCWKLSQLIVENARITFLSLKNYKYNSYLPFSMPKRSLSIKDVNFAFPKKHWQEIFPCPQLIFNPKKQLPQQGQSPRKRF